MKRMREALLCAVIGFAAVQVSVSNVGAQEPKLLLIRMTANELAAQGLAVRELRMRPFPNSCAAAGNPRISIADAFLKHFQSRGFTLESLCLGLSSAIHFDPETGKQLPLAHLYQLKDSRESVIPLNLPDCFRNAVSDLDCNSRYDTWERFKLEPHDNPRSFAIKFDAMVRQYIRQNRISGVFRVEDLGHGLFTSSYEWLLASSALPHGYGYALHGPEGDDPEEETVDLSTYRKKGDVGSLWNDGR